MFWMFLTFIFLIYILNEILQKKIFLNVRGNMAKEKTKKIKVPTAKKRDTQNEKKRLQNKSFKSKVKSAISSFKETLKNDGELPAQERLNFVFSLVDKASSKKIYKKNKSSRIKSKLNLLLQKTTNKAL
jgi:small subunit ribosomal protein S20